MFFNACSQLINTLLLVFTNTRLEGFSLLYVQQGRVALSDLVENRGFTEVNIRQSVTLLTIICIASSMGEVVKCQFISTILGIQ